MRRRGRSCGSCRRWRNTSRKTLPSRNWNGGQEPRATLQRQRKCKGPSRSCLPVSKGRRRREQRGVRVPPAGRRREPRRNAILRVLVLNYCEQSKTPKQNLLRWKTQNIGRGRPLRPPVGRHREVQKSSQKGGPVVGRFAPASRLIFG